MLVSFDNGKIAKWEKTSRFGADKYEKIIPWVIEDDCQTSIRTGIDWQRLFSLEKPSPSVRKKIHRNPRRKQITEVIIAKTG